jgi:FkbM family methyltransferase
MPKNLFLNIYQKSIKKMSNGRGFGKNPIIKKILKNIEGNLKTEFAEVQGSKMFLDPGDSLDLSINGVYGELDTKIIREEIHEGDIVIDVGANIGYYTLIFAQLVGKSGKVIAFEPESKNFEILKKNVEINNYDNVIVEQKIVSEKCGKMKLYVSDSDIVGHRIQQMKNLKNFVEVESVTLDDYMKKLNLDKKVNFIKIDVEGAEPNVLEGSNKILEENDQLKIFTEFNREVIKKYDVEPKKMIDLLYRNGFKIYLPNYNNNKINLTSANELLTSKETLLENINLLCKK